MQFARLRMSSRSQNLLGLLKTRTGLTPNVTGRFAICLSLDDPSVPNPDEFDENGSEIHPSTLFGDHEDLFASLMTLRLRKEGLDPETYCNRMLRAHFNRGTIALYSRVQDVSDFGKLVRQERRK